MGFQRPRPDWQVLLYQQGLGLLVGCKLIEGLVHARWRIFADEVYPLGRVVDLFGGLPGQVYGVLVGVQVFLLALYLARVKLRVTAPLLALTVFVDALAAAENHRVLLAIQMGLVALQPVPKAPHYLGHRPYENMGLQALQISLLYLFTAAQKFHPQFLSGETLRDVFWHIQRGGGRVFSEKVFGWLQDRHVCRTLALLVVSGEIVLALTLPLRRWTGWAQLGGWTMHILFWVFLPGGVWIFSLQMFLAFTCFLPTRIAPDGGYRVLVGRDASGPSWFLRLLWPGMVREVQTQAPLQGWGLERPDGELLRGYDAWLELWALSPATFWAAEIMRIAPLRWLGRRLAGRAR